MRLVLLGGSGHCLDIVGLVLDINNSLHKRRIKKLSIVGILSDVEIDSQRFSDSRVQHVGRISDLNSIDATHYIIAVGSAQDRLTIFKKIQTDLQAATLIHPSVAAGFGCTFGEGTVILGGTRLSPKCTIGNHVYVSHGVLIGHETKISNFCSIFPGANIAGNASLGLAATAGSGCTVIEKIVVNDYAYIAAGSVVIREVPHGAKVMGAPAKERS